jgi:hypothetical protein
MRPWAQSQGRHLETVTLPSMLMPCSCRHCHIGRAQLGPEELAAANAAAGTLRAALLQHASAQSDGYRQQAGTLGWGPAEWARHAAAATYTATGEPGAAGAPALELLHSSEYLPQELGNLAKAHSLKNLR